MVFVDTPATDDLRDENKRIRFRLSCHCEAAGRGNLPVQCLIRKRRRLPRRLTAPRNDSGRRYLAGETLQGKKSPASEEVRISARTPVGEGHDPPDQAGESRCRSGVTMHRDQPTSLGNYPTWSAGSVTPPYRLKKSPVSGETGDFLGSEVAEKTFIYSRSPTPRTMGCLPPQCEQFSRRASRLSAGRGRSRRRRPASRPQPR